jgi:hypothetical protein
MVVVCRERRGYAIGVTVNGRNGRVQWTGPWVDHAEGNKSKSAKHGKRDSQGVLLELCVFSLRFPLIL